MLDIIVKAIFWVLNYIASIVLAPILTIFTIIFGPDVSNVVTTGVTNVFSYIDIVSNYIVAAIDLLCIPRSLFSFLILIIGSVLGYVVFARTYMFAMAIYRHFKP